MDRYILGPQIGEGSFGNVFYAERKVSKEKVRKMPLSFSLTCLTHGDFVE